GKPLSLRLQSTAIAAMSRLKALAAHSCAAWSQNPKSTASATNTPPKLIFLAQSRQRNPSFIVVAGDGFRKSSTHPTSDPQGGSAKRHAPIPSPRRNTLRYCALLLRLQLRVV